MALCLVCCCVDPDHGPKAYRAFVMSGHSRGSGLYPIEVFSTSDCTQDLLATERFYVV